MSAKGKYVPDPDLDDDGMDLGKYDNDCGFDEDPDASSSEDELWDFESLAKHKRKPEDVGADAGFKKRYAAYLKKNGLEF